MVRMNKHQYGLVLSGGAARGFAHIGVLKSLEEHGIFPEIISGVSAGAIAGVFYADGFSPEEILEIFDKKKIFHFIKLSLPNNGLLDTGGLKRVIKNNLRSKTFEQLKKTFFATATNYKTGKPEYFCKGDLVDAVLASSSIPVLFKPYTIDGNLYLDGGVTDKLPVRPVKNLCKKIIGVNVMPVGEEKNSRGLLNVALRSFHMSVASYVDLIKEGMDIFIEPVELGRFAYLDVANGKNMFEIGYQEANRVLEQINIKANVG